MDVYLLLEVKKKKVQDLNVEHPRTLALNVDKKINDTPSNMS